MKRYHLYAIGNALVDMEFAVDEPFLSKQRIDKGVMTLVDEPRQHELLAALSAVHGKRSGGGSAANTVMAAARFGSQCFYSCKVADDAAGDFFVSDLQAAGVDSNLEGERPQGVTGKCLVLVTPDAERTMNTFLGISEQVGVDDLQPQAIAQSEYVYLEGYLVTSASGRAAAIKARQLAQRAQAKVALTFSDPAMVQFFKPGLIEMIGPGVDLLFCNRAEAMAWADTSDLNQAVEAIGQIAKQFVITLGQKGALAFDGQTLHTIAGTPTAAVDTNGAGDMFAGAFLHGLTHQADFARAGRLASRAAAAVVAQFGPRLSAAQHENLLHSESVGVL